MSRRLFVLIAAIAAMTLAAGACGSAPIAPAALDTRVDSCAFCRMMVSDHHRGSQIVAPYEEPQFFDDLSCLAGQLGKRTVWPARTMVYVADHRTGSWVAAGRAIYVRSARAGAMGSPFLAYETVASRDADPDAASGVTVAFRDVFVRDLPGDAP